MLSTTSVPGASLFLHHKFIARVTSLPANLKFRGSVGKHLLNKILEQLLPIEIPARAKMGCGVRLARWLQVPLRSRVEWLPYSLRVNAKGILEPRGLEQLVARHLSGQRDHSPGIWSLLMLDGVLRSPCPTFSR